MNTEVTQVNRPQSFVRYLGVRFQDAPRTRSRPIFPITSLIIPLLLSSTFQKTLFFLSRVNFPCYRLQ